jgi:uncharacterized membrane protein
MIDCQRGIEITAKTKLNSEKIKYKYESFPRLTEKFFTAIIVGIIAKIKLK